MVVQRCPSVLITHVDVWQLSKLDTFSVFPLYGRFQSKKVTFPPVIYPSHKKVNIWKTVFRISNFFKGKLSLNPAENKQQRKVANAEVNKKVYCRKFKFVLSFRCKNRNILLRSLNNQLPSCEPTRSHSEPSGSGVLKNKMSVGAFLNWW